MGNINARETEDGKGPEIGCVAVKSRCEDRTHCVRSEDSEQLQCMLESEFLIVARMCVCLNTCSMSCHRIYFGTHLLRNLKVGGEVCGSMRAILLEQTARSLLTFVRNNRS